MAASELHFNNPYQLIVSVMLSAQCTDKKVNEVTPTLFRRYSSFEALAKAELKTLEHIIRPINYYRTKSKNLKAMAQMVTQIYDGKLPSSLDELKGLPGVGQKTASVIQCEMGTGYAFPVDTHVFRVAKRLGLAQGKTPLHVETELKARFTPRHWRNLHHRLILHGRKVCKSTHPLCRACRLTRLCAWYQDIQLKLSTSAPR